MKKNINITKYIGEFGVGIFLLKAIRSQSYKSTSRLSWKLNEVNEKVIGTYLEKMLERTRLPGELTEEYKNPAVSKQPVWMMWWQGEEAAPDIVRICIQSVKSNCGRHEVIVITEENINQYIHLPGFILEKVRTGAISRTHLSDLVRLQLLAVYGGVWIDATVLVTDPIPEELFDREWYSLKFGKYTKDPSHGRWTAFLIFSKAENHFIQSALEGHYKYWSCHDMLIDYIIVDYMLDYVIKHDENARKLIESVPVNNQGVFSLRPRLNQAARDGKSNWKQEGTIFYKLSWKDDLQEEVEGKKTVYGKLLEQFL